MSVENDYNSNNNSEKTIKNVDVKQCIYTIIFSALALLIFLVPFTFGNTGISSAISHLGSDLFSTSSTTIDGFTALLGEGSSLVGLINTILDLDALLFLLILLFNIVASLILIVLRSPLLRRVFKIISIFAGIIMIVITIFSLVHVVGIVASAFANINPEDVNGLMTILETSGLLFVLATFVASLLLIKWQFRWFDSLW